LSCADAGTEVRFRRRFEKKILDCVQEEERMFFSCGRQKSSFKSSVSTAGTILAARGGRKGFENLLSDGDEVVGEERGLFLSPCVAARTECLFEPFARCGRGRREFGPK